MDNKKDEYSQNSFLKDIINPDSYTFFKDNFRFIFCYKKTTKLLKAIYVLTEDLKEEEEEVLIIRQLAKDIVKDIIAFFTLNKAANLQSLHQHVLLIASLFEAISSIGLISGMNANIIVAEYHGILEKVEELSQYGKTSTSPLELDRAMFELSGTPDPLSKASFTSDYSQGHKGQSSTADYKKEMSFKVSKNNVGKMMSLNLKSVKDRNANVVTSFINSAAKQSGRRDLIIKEIRQKGSVTVKDISTLIKGVSEKTIQRELVSLMERGVLKREGERRWSRYVLAS